MIGITRGYIIEFRLGTPVKLCIQKLIIYIIHYFPTNSNRKKLISKLLDMFMQWVNEHKKRCADARICASAQRKFKSAVIPRRYPQASARLRMHTRRYRYPVRHYQI